MCQLVADVMEVDAAQISLTSSADSVEGWDSLKLLALAVAVEERYGIALDPEELEAVTDVASLLALLQKAGR